MYNIWDDYNTPMPGEGPFFTDYLWKAQKDWHVGLEFIDWEETRYTYLAPHKSHIIKLFNDQYKYRELGVETESRFQDTLQMVFNRIADKYNHAFKVTEENDVDKLGTGYQYEETRNRNTQSDSTIDNDENRNLKYKDTPSSETSTLNNPTSQNIDARDSSSTGHGEEDETVTITRDNTKHDKEMIEELSDLINKYRQLEVEFVYEFNGCFMGIFYPYNV